MNTRLLAGLLLGTLPLATGCAVLKKGGQHLGLSNNQIDAIEGAGKDLKAAASEMSLADERNFGETVSLQAYATPEFGAPIRDERVMRYVNTLASIIGRNGDRPLIPYFVAVIDTDAINAFATPGGYIFITKGAILTMRSEGELACVLGHEVAHVTEKHALGTLKRTKLLTGIGKGLAAAADQDPAQFDKIVKELCSSLLNNAFDSGKEIDADVKGVEFAYNAGYDPRAMLDFIDTIEKHTKHLRGGLSSHPGPADRREALGEFFATLDAEDLEDVVKHTSRFKEFQSWLREPATSWK